MGNSPVIMPKPSAETIRPYAWLERSKTVRNTGANHRDRWRATKMMTVRAKSRLRTNQGCRLTVRIRSGWALIVANFVNLWQASPSNSSRQLSHRPSPRCRRRFFLGCPRRKLACMLRASYHGCADFQHPIHVLHVLRADGVQPVFQRGWTVLHIDGNAVLPGGAAARTPWNFTPLSATNSSVSTKTSLETPADR